MADRYLSEHLFEAVPPGTIPIGIIALYDEIDTHRQRLLREDVPKSQRIEYSGCARLVNANWESKQMDNLDELHTSAAAMSCRLVSLLRLCEHPVTY